jgi:hypothetical protein
MQEVNAIFEGRQLRTNLLRRHARYYVGVDLGQAQDYTAVAVIERAELVHPERDPLTWSFRSETRFHVRHAERVPLGSPYPEVVEHVRRLVKREPLAGQATVIVDATGVGAPVVDLMRRSGLGCRVIPVVITSGDLESSDGTRYRVPKRDLIAGLQVALQRRRLQVAGTLRAAGALAEELRGMRLRTTSEGYEQYSGRRHDDLVVALALGWWRASRESWE